MGVVCQRCGCEIPSLNKLRKWCVDCRRILTNERAKERNKRKRAGNGKKAKSPEQARSQTK
ncbi:MAG: hypothetical protein R6U32_02985 [Candidatus Woesearchaeota archaeon]